MSAPTVQNILNREGLGTRHERWLRLERETAEKETELTTEQVAFIEKHNPCFKERQAEPSRPVKLLRARRHLLRWTSKGSGQGLRMHAVIDTYCSFAFGFLHVFKKQPEAAVAVLHNEALPFYAETGLKAENVLTDNGKEFCGSEGHHYRLYLELNDIEHRTTK